VRAQGPEAKAEEMAGAFGTRGWTALPVTALCLCVPSLLAGVTAGISQLQRGGLPGPSTSALWFAGLAVFFTPAAAILILLLSLRRRWAHPVVLTSWLVVIVSAAIMVPAIEVAVANLAEAHVGSRARGR
jgi:hypothetical protein